MATWLSWWCRSRRIITLEAAGCRFRKFLTECHRMRTAYAPHQCVKSCSLRRHDGQIGFLVGSSRWGYWCKEGCWPDVSLASSTSSFQFLICFESGEAFWSWYTCTTHSCAAGLSRICWYILILLIRRSICSVSFNQNLTKTVKTYSVGLRFFLKFCS